MGRGQTPRNQGSGQARKAPAPLTNANRVPADPRRPEARERRHLARARVDAASVRWTRQRGLPPADGAPPRHRDERRQRAASPQPNGLRRRSRRGERAGRLRAGGRRRRARHRDQTSGRAWRRRGHTERGVDEPSRRARRAKAKARRRIEAGRPHRETPRRRRECASCWLTTCSRACRTATSRSRFRVHSAFVHSPNPS